MDFIYTPLIASSLINDCSTHANDHVSHLEIVAGLNNMAVACIKSSEHAEAEQLFHRALNKANEFTFFSNTPLHIHNSRLNKSQDKNLYICQRGEYDEGMHTFTEPLTIDPIFDTLDYNSVTAIILFNLGQLCMKLEDDNEASEYFYRSLAISQRNVSPCVKRGSNNLNTTAILHNIGHVHYRSGNYEESIRTFTKALVIGREAFACCHLEVAATLNCLGVLYFHMPKSDTEQAMDLFLESLTIRRAFLGNEHKDVATTLNNIGRIHYMKGDYDEALVLYQEALRIRRVTLGDDHLDFAATVYNAGQTHHQRGELVEAMESYRQFLIIAKARLGDQHRDVAIMLKCMAQIHHECKE